MTKLLPEEEITKGSYDKYGKVWAKKYQDDGFWAKNISKLYKLRPGGSVIDVGCGSGRDAKKLIAAGFEYTGTDISETLLDIARNDLPGQKFLNQSIYDMEFTNKFDAFWCTAVLLHIPKRRINQALLSIKSVLKPGAVGFISTKDGVGDELEEYEISGKTFKRYYAYWSKEDFTAVLKKNGFEVVEYKYRPENERQRWHCFFVKLK